MLASRGPGAGRFPTPGIDLTFGVQEKDHDNDPSEKKSEISSR